MDYEYRAAKTPLIDLLRKVPKDGRHMYDESPVMAHNIPYGRLCHEAADELEAWNRRASQDLASGVTILPDGSGFAIASFPLPNDHWIYAPREYIGDSIEPVELPKPLLSHDQRDTVIAAIRYAVRGATMLGKEMDFDPDALVQNAVYALCGPYGSATVKQAASDEPVAWMHNSPGRFDVIHAEVKNLLARQAVESHQGFHRPLDKTEHYTIPLYDHTKPCERCKELEEQVHFQSCLTRDLLPYQDEAVKGRDKLAALEAELADRASPGMVMMLKSTIAQQAEQLAEAHKQVESLMKAIRKAVVCCAHRSKLAVEEAYQILNAAITANGEGK